MDGETLDSFFIPFPVLLGSAMCCLFTRELQAQGPDTLMLTHSLVTAPVLMSAQQVTLGAAGPLWEGQSREAWGKWAASEMVPKRPAESWWA